METTTEKQFIELYNNPEITAHQLKQKLGLNNNNYRKLKEKTGLTGRRNIIKGKHYTKTQNGRIAINKRINGKKEYLGMYKNKEEAKKVIEVCEKHNWDINHPEVQETIKKHRKQTKHYSKINGRYYVYKNINGKRIYYDHFKTKQDAEDCVRLLEKLEWNKTVYDQLKVII